MNVIKNMAVVNPKIATSNLHLIIIISDTMDSQQHAQSITLNKIMIIFITIVKIYLKISDIFTNELK